MSVARLNAIYAAPFGVPHSFSHLETFLKVIAFILLTVFSLSASGEDYDVGVAGRDYEIIVQPDHIKVIEDNAEVYKFCGRATLGCALLGKTVPNSQGHRETHCYVYIRSRLLDGGVTLRHELKHCFGWVHEEMPLNIQKSRVDRQERWLKKHHKIWFSLSEEHLEKLRSR